MTGGGAGQGGGERHYRAGDVLEDLCRACKALREHRVLAADADGRLLRVVCGFCGSQHNYRGARDPTPERASGGAGAAAGVRRLVPGGAHVDAPALVDERERRYPQMSLDSEAPGADDLELMLRRVIREEIGLTPVAMAERWRGGDLVLRPFKKELQEKSIPIETFFHKIIMIRNRLRTLEQQVNASTLPEEQKVRLQNYVTGCYGSLTSFNILFAEDEDRFEGAAGGGTGD